MIVSLLAFASLAIISVDAIPAGSAALSSTTSATAGSSLKSSVSSAAAASSSTSSSSQSSDSSACSGNSASDRTTWCDYSIDTDYYTKVPDTGVTREYWLELVNTTASPDGYERIVLTVNGTVPGPTLYADWGDTVKVHLSNSLENNGTSLHFHGIRQNYTNPEDGVASITQCPTAPGDSITYEWRATQYGTTWYHSHFSLQAWDGVFGGIIINGPASSNYDEDAGMLFLNDWSHNTADYLYHSAQVDGPSNLHNGLINDTNTYEDDDGNETGSRFTMAVTSGKSYRMRLVNGAIDTHFKFMIDNHTLTVMSTDLVPIEPYNTTVLSIGIGQRYDVVVTADQDDVATDFWMRAIPQEACSDDDSVDNIKGIFHYGTSTDDAETPSTSAYSFTDTCLDESVDDLVPVVSYDASTSTYSDSEDAAVAYNSDNLFRWYLSDTTFEVEWENPTLLQIYDGATSWSNASHVVEVDGTDNWVTVVIETSTAVPHPIHLHGHDFLILAQGTGTYSDNVTLSEDNPPRRDIAMLPSSGYLVFALQFIERYSEISSMIDYDTMNATCTNWDTYATEYDVVVDDDESGI